MINIWVGVPYYKSDQYFKSKLLVVNEPLQKYWSQVYCVEFCEYQTRGSDNNTSRDNLSMILKLGVP
jgi:hypothetical protein